MMQQIRRGLLTKPPSEKVLYFVTPDFEKISVSSAG